MLYNLSDYHFDLPKELIAQYPVSTRDRSRLMVIDRKKETIEEIAFHELPFLLEKGDSLVFNNTKVIPARLIGKRLTGGETEIFLLQQVNKTCWKVLVRPGRKVKKGTVVLFGEAFSCTILEELNEGERLAEFSFEGDFYEVLARHGEIPLPLYIERKAEKKVDEERYQTVYAKEPGAVAAPTAGLHFTKELLDTLKGKGIDQHYVTLHTGIGTFKPVKVDDIRAHVMHRESCRLSEETAAALNKRAEKNRQVCVGTTSCRVLETAADEKGLLHPGEYETDIFIYPGYRFKYVNTLLTNFHLPGSTLLMLVSAFAGHEIIKEAYARAVEKKFRFFSYGDAMIIL